jgi:hypothetical protein
VRILRASFLLGGLFSGATLVLAQGSGTPISTPAARETVLALAARLSTMDAPVRREAIEKDPFYPSVSELNEETARRGDTMTDQQRLELIAAQLNPTGSVELGGEPQLLFTEKRQKIGDKLTVLLDKVEYTVEIVSIEKNRFRIRYNNLETTRSIK